MTFLLISIVALILSTLGAAAHDVPCAPRAEMIPTLESQYREEQVMIGISSDGNFMEVYRSEVGGWTITLTTPAGQTCLMMMGQDGEIIQIMEGKPS